MGMSTGYTIILYTHMLKMAKLALSSAILAGLLSLTLQYEVSEQNGNSTMITENQEFHGLKFSRGLMVCPYMIVRQHARTWKNAVLGLGLKNANNVAYDRLASNQLTKKERVESRQVFQVDKKQQTAMFHPLQQLTR